MNYKNKANIILGIVSVFFIFSFLLKYYVINNVYTDFVFTVIKAALVGSVADWFAITAIYRKPLGISFHTALIPRNREKIVEATAAFVEKELLSREAIKNKIEKNNIAVKISKTIISNKDNINLKVIQMLNEYISKADKNNIKRKIKDLRTGYLNEFYDKKRIKCVLTCIYKNDGEKILDSIFDFLIYVVKKDEVQHYIYDAMNKLKKENTKGFIFKLGLSLFEASDSVNLRDASLVVQDELLDKVRKLKNSEDAYRKKISAFIEQYLNNLQDDNVLENFKNYIFKDENIDSLIDKIFVKSKIVFNSYETEGYLITKIIFDIFSSVFEKVVKDEEKLNEICRYIETVVIDIFEEKHYVIGKFIRDTLNEFDDDKLNKFIDDKVGSDLQWIRINGSVVGGFVGMIIFLIMNFIYNPFLAPQIRRIF
ncbi:DUF445 domain-containing protein [Clostridium felsineum]|uniref:DUF445 domain-containing protein n=1 Tax=Clostridium felsineum TaxID=36839 RepID=UPI00098C45E4|nr:DUF445 family protein [Clostridium felsineum]URZ15697.1 hypothetical protein CLFE_017430 [Clostridium felsineum DSM 794]